MITALLWTSLSLAAPTAQTTIQWKWPDHATWRVETRWQVAHGAEGETRTSQDGASVAIWDWSATKDGGHTLTSRAGTSTHLSPETDTLARELDTKLRAPQSAVVSAAHIVDLQQARAVWLAEPNGIPHDLIVPLPVALSRAFNTLHGQVLDTASLTGAGVREGGEGMQGAFYTDLKLLTPCASPSGSCLEATFTRLTHADEQGPLRPGAKRDIETWLLDLASLLPLSSSRSVQALYADSPEKTTTLTLTRTFTPVSTVAPSGQAR